jgi:hypothetical protein
MNCLRIQYGFGEQLPEAGIILFRRLKPVLLCRQIYCAGMEGSIGDNVLKINLPGRNPGFGLTENTEDLFVGRTLLHGDVLK